MKKKLIVELEFIEEEETRNKPLVTQNLVVFPVKGGYEFYYSDNQKEFSKLSLKKARVIEVAQIDDVQQLLLEGKMSQSEKNVLRQKN